MTFGWRSNEGRGRRAAHREMTWRLQVGVHRGARPRSISRRRTPSATTSTRPGTCTRPHRGATAGNVLCTERAEPHLQSNMKVVEFAFHPRLTPIHVYATTVLISPPLGATNDRCRAVSKSLSFARHSAAATDNAGRKVVGVGDNFDLQAGLKGRKNTDMKCENSPAASSILRIVSTRFRLQSRVPNCAARRASSASG
jgi:hypothetical protein